jgi:hypothetical protein
MTNERKAELFEGAMNLIYGHMTYGDATEIEETLEAVGFTSEEIADVLAEVEEE